jgi:hypothetical protein
MSRYYNIPNKVNLPIVPSTNDIEPMLLSKGKTGFTIEHEKKSSWPMKHRYPAISTAKENTPPRRTPPVYQSKSFKPWQSSTKTSTSKAGESSRETPSIVIVRKSIRCRRSRSSIDVQFHRYE